MSTLSREELLELSRAREVLEHPSLAIRLADRVGRPIEGLVQRLPEGARDALSRATRRALDLSLTAALSTLDRGARDPEDWLHRAAALAVGAAGGAVGIAGLALELPISLTVMLRSIAAHARAQGEDLGEVAARLECLTVFAYGSPAAEDDAADSAYFAVRAAFATSLGKAAEYVAQRGTAGALADRSAPALVQLVARIGQRLGVAVTDKAAAQLVPLLGAAGGAAINALFLQHYQDTARAHFTVRRLERAHGPEAVRRAYAEAP